MPQADTALVVAGPTCSGKSGLALALAERLGGVVVNADSMQVYRELRLLTARPTPADEARAPHALYGVRPAALPGDAAWWRGAALEAMAAARDAGRVPILCGGTGLYLTALANGLSELPAIPQAARDEARTLLARDGPAALHAMLAAVDPPTAARLRPSDGQRIARAWEVWRGTGRGLADWHSTLPPPSPWQFRLLLLDPPRDTLRRAAAARFQAMLAAGALDEVRALLALGLDPALPAMRALGVPDLAAVLQGRCSLEDATTQAVLATGRYAKRQATWFRRQRIAAPSLTHTIFARFENCAQLTDSMEAELRSFLHSPG